MSIQEIKKRHEESIKDGEFQIFAADIEFLLTTIERQKAEYEQLEERMEKRTLIAAQTENEYDLERDRNLDLHGLNHRLVEALEECKKHARFTPEAIESIVDDTLQAFKLLEKKD